MHKVYKVLLVLFVLLSLPILRLAAQDSRPKFEVASIKRSVSREIGLRPEADRFVATGMTLHNVIQFAYLPCDGRPLLDNQIIGAPGWADADTYDIEAKAESRAQPIPVCEMKQMVQSLLAERFQLKAHVDTRELPVYNLIVVKQGKLKPSPDQTPPPPPAPFDPSGPLPRGMFMTRLSGSHQTTLSGSAITMERFVKALQGSGSGSELRSRPVLDNTGLKGLFDVQLQFGPESTTAAPPSDSTGPSIFTALEEQLGLKLESSKAPVEVLVVDSIGKPSEN